MSTHASPSARAAHPQAVASPVVGTPAQVFNAAWFLRRALIGILVLTAAVGGFAWLTYTSLEAADADTAPAGVHLSSKN